MFLNTAPGINPPEGEPTGRRIPTKHVYCGLSAGKYPQNETKYPLYPPCDAIMAVPVFPAMGKNSELTALPVPSVTTPLNRAFVTWLQAGQPKHDAKSNIRAPFQNFIIILPPKDSVPN